VGSPDRRDDVFNGVEFLDSSRSTANHWEDGQWRYFIDGDGRKFLEGMDLRDI